MTGPPLPFVSIVVEGNIGAGKTTFLRALEAAVREEMNPVVKRPLCTCGRIPGEAIIGTRLQGEETTALMSQLAGKDTSYFTGRFQFCMCPGDRTTCQTVLSVAPEPVEKWTLLKDFYADPQRYAFPLQRQIMENQPETDPQALFQVQERCAGSGFHVFTKALVEDGVLDEEFELESLDRTLSLYPLSKQIPPYIVYIQASPAKCLERIGRRQRINESAQIDLTYLEGLERHYDKFLDMCKAYGSRVYRIPMEQDMDDDEIQGIASAFVGSMVDLRLRQMNPVAQEFEVRLLKKMGSGEEAQEEDV